MSEEGFTAGEARRVGKALGIDWDSAPFDVEEEEVQRERSGIAVVARRASPSSAGQRRLELEAGGSEHRAIVLQNQGVVGLERDDRSQAASAGGEQAGGKSVSQSELRPRDGG